MIGEYSEPTINGLWSDEVAQETGMERIEEPNTNEDVERWVEVDSEPLEALHTSIKNGTPTIATVDNAELPNVL